MKALAVPDLAVKRFELRCGATLLVSPRPDAPVAAVQAHLRGGHSLDPPGLGGTAYLAGRFVDQGTRDFSEEEIAEALEPAGGSLSGGSTGISGQIAGTEWKTLLDLVSSCLLHPTYPKAKIELQRRRVLDRLLVERDDPRLQGAWLFRRLVYGDHWLARPNYGTLESVPRIGRADLTRFHRRNVAASRLVLAVCADADPQKVRRFLDRRLAALPKGKPLPPVDRSFPEPAPRTGVFTAKRQQVHVFFGHLGIERRDPDYGKLAVMDHILGTGPGFSNRISRILRDELGLAYTVQAAIHSSAGVLPGTFSAYIGTSPQHLTTAVEGFRREIRRIQTELVTKAELDLAKDYLTGSLPLGYERASRRVQSMVFAHRTGLPEDHLRRELESYAAVTREDVRAAARGHLFPDRAVLVAAGPVDEEDIL
ncbi:MAG TPA: insulinase family protein [Planctomycetes bacterium]|nr:insulinase family protein [Planctomycetota bacterium]